MSLSKHHPYQAMRDQSAILLYPEQETVKSLSPIQEEGPEKLRCTIRLYDVTSPPRRDGNFMLKIMPSNSADMMTESMANFPQHNHPKGFIDILGNNNGELEQRYSWNVELNEQLTVDVKMLGVENCIILFRTKKILTRKQILSQPLSRLPSDCASVEFTIQSHCEKTCERRFRVTVKTDVEGSRPQTRDYNVMFTRKPQEPEETHIGSSRPIL